MGIRLSYVLAITPDFFQDLFKCSFSYFFKMKVFVALCLLFGIISTIAAPTDDAGQKIKDGAKQFADGIQDGVNDVKDAIDDQLSSRCVANDNCYFFQECSNLECQLTTWAWIVLVVAAVLVVLGVISCVCCCVKKIFCCSN